MTRLPKYIKAVIAGHLNYGDIMNLLSTCMDYATLFTDEVFWLYLIRQHYNLSPIATAFLKYRHLYIESILYIYYGRPGVVELQWLTVGDKIKMTFYDRPNNKFCESVPESYKCLKFNNIVYIQVWWGKSETDYMLINSKNNLMIKSGETSGITHNFFELEYRLLVHDAFCDNFYCINSLTTKVICECKDIRRYFQIKSGTYPRFDHLLQQKMDSGQNLHWEDDKFWMQLNFSAKYLLVLTNNQLDILCLVLKYDDLLQDETLLSVLELTYWEYDQFVHQLTLTGEYEELAFYIHVVTDPIQIKSVNVVSPSNDRLLTDLRLGIANLSKYKFKYMSWQ